MKKYIAGFLLMGTVLSTHGQSAGFMDFIATVVDKVENVANRLDNPDGINVELDNQTGKDLKFATTGRGQNGLERCIEAVADMACPTVPNFTVAAGKKETVMYRSLSVPKGQNFKFKVIAKSGPTFSRCAIDSATRGKTYRFVVDNSGVFGKINCTMKQGR